GGVQHREPDGISGSDRAGWIHGRQPAGRPVVPRPRVQRTETAVARVQLRAGDEGAPAAGAHTGIARRGRGETMTTLLLTIAFAAKTATQPAPPPPDAKPGSITCEECPYPYPSSYLPLTLYGQDVRIAFMDVAPNGTANGHTVVLLHGNNFAGFYFGGPIDLLRKAGFRVVVPDQIGYGRSSKPIIPYNFHDMARNTRLILQHLKIDRVMVVGHSMGGMLAARFATQDPDLVERLVLYNPIGLSDGRFDRPWDSTDEGYKRTLAATYQSVRNGLMRYVSHNPTAWTPQFEQYARLRYSWTLVPEST